MGVQTIEEKKHFRQSPMLPVTSSAIYKKYSREQQWYQYPILIDTEPDVTPVTSSVVFKKIQESRGIFRVSIPKQFLFRFQHTIFRFQGFHLNTQSNTTFRHNFTSIAHKESQKFLPRMLKAQTRVLNKPQNFEFEILQAPMKETQAQKHDCKVEMRWIYVGLVCGGKV